MVAHGRRRYFDAAEHLRDLDGRSVSEGGKWPGRLAPLSCLPQHFSIPFRDFQSFTALQRPVSYRFTNGRLGNATLLGVSLIVWPHGQSLEHCTITKRQIDKTE